MRFDDEFITMLRDEPLRGLDLLCDQVLSDVAAGDPEEPWNDANYKLMIETYALLWSLQESGLLPVKIPNIEIAGDVEGECRLIFQNVRRIQGEVRGLTAQRELEKLTRQYTAALGVRFAYEFTAGDYVRLQKLLNEMRELITAAEGFEEDHRRRLLARLEKLQSELHKRISDLDHFWGLVGDAGVALGKFGKDAKPLVDRVREVVGIIWRTQSRAEELSSDTPPPLLERDLASSENSSGPSST